MFPVVSVYNDESKDYDESVFSVHIDWPIYNTLLKYNIDGPNFYDLILTFLDL